MTGFWKAYQAVKCLYHISGCECHEHDFSPILLIEDVELDQLTKVVFANFFPVTLFSTTCISSYFSFWIKFIKWEEGEEGVCVYLLQGVDIYISYLHFFFIKKIRVFSHFHSHI